MSVVPGPLESAARECFLHIMDWESRRQIYIYIYTSHIHQWRAIIEACYPDPPFNVSPRSVTISSLYIIDFTFDCIGHILKLQIEVIKLCGDQRQQYRFERLQTIPVTNTLRHTRHYQTNCTLFEERTL